MKPEQIMSAFLKKDHSVLHLGGDPELASFMSAHKYVRVEANDIDDFSSLPQDNFDYVVLGDILETSDNPVDLIKYAKNLAKSTVIYEFKYDADCEVKPEWKQPWNTTGLEFVLTREFDYVNNIFLGYATIHICEMPYTADPNTKEHPDAIR